jgi:two-component system, OmpR family, sensor kinase
MNILRFRLPPLGVRLQLTLWYTAVFAVLILGAGLLVYGHLEDTLKNDLSSTLDIQMQQVIPSCTYWHGQVSFHEGDSDGDYDSLPSFIQTDHNTQQNIEEQTLFRLVNMNGSVVDESPSLHGVAIPAVSVTEPVVYHSDDPDSNGYYPWDGTIELANHEQFWMHSEVLLSHGKPYAVLQLAMALTSVHKVLRRVAIELLLLAPIILILGALGSFWLAKRAFAPIEHLTSTARAIKEGGDLNQRVIVPRAHDEVYGLAVTLNEMIGSLEETFKRQRRFVADASHELRTPVAAIRSKTDLALSQLCTPQEYAAILQNINGETERLGQLISDLLALARADERYAYLEKEPVHLEILAQAVAANAEMLAEERNISLHIDADYPVIVLGDEARLIQVVMNLLDNALIYTNAGGAVTLSVTSDQQSASIKVSDTGEGIALEHLDHIFERFYRVDAARTRREGGSSGLGLAIVDWVVRAHQGMIEVESQPGLGSTFTVILPLLMQSPDKRGKEEKMLNAPLKETTRL